MSDEPIITYIRVSTSGQGRSGLGIEAQRNTLAQFANSERLVVAQGRDAPRISGLGATDTGHAEKRCPGISL